jgi:hypothetical protein
MEARAAANASTTLEIIEYACLAWRIRRGERPSIMGQDPGKSEQLSSGELRLLLSRNTLNFRLTRRVCPVDVVRT